MDLRVVKEVTAFLVFDLNLLEILAEILPEKSETLCRLKAREDLKSTINRGALA